MEAAEALARLGGVASAQVLLRLTTRRSIRRAVHHGTIQHSSRGRYLLPTADEAAAAAARLHAVVCLRSAAAVHGWELKQQPAVPEVAVPRHRRVGADRREDVSVSWLDLGMDDIAQGVTTPLRTVVDCARRLPFDEALAIADSALRSGSVTVDELLSVRVQGAGSAAVRRVLEAADGRAANVFESVLRALCLEAGLVVEPQAAVDLGSGTIHPDLVCRRLRVVIEADSWSFHASRTAHQRDCARYNLLVLHGWRVLRFTWEQVMHRPAYVRWVLRQIVAAAGAGSVELAEPTGRLARPA